MKRWIARIWLLCIFGTGMLSMFSYLAYKDSFVRVLLCVFVLFIFTFWAAHNCE